MFAEHQQLRENRREERIIDRKKRQVIALEMSCPWIESRSKKEEEKTLKYIVYYVESFSNFFPDMKFVKLTSLKMS